MPAWCSETQRDCCCLPEGPAQGGCAGRFLQKDSLPGGRQLRRLAPQSFKEGGRTLSRGEAGVRGLRRTHRIELNFRANSTSKSGRCWELQASLTVTSALSLDAFLLLTHVHTPTHTHTLHTLIHNTLTHTSHTDTTYTHHTQHTHTLITYTTHTLLIHITHIHYTHTCHPPQTTCTHTHSSPTVYQIMLAQESHPGKSSL